MAFFHFDQGSSQVKKITTENMLLITLRGDIGRQEITFFFLSLFCFHLIYLTPAMFSLVLLPCSSWGSIQADPSGAETAFVGTQACATTSCECSVKC